MIRYRECQKNHAAHLGSRVVDGCGEFMPAGDEGTPESLRCAACDCHRNFHRREIDIDGELTTTVSPPLPPHRTTAITAAVVPARNCYITFNKPTSQNRAPVMMAFGGGGGGTAAESSSEDLKGMEPYYGGARKRFRTKFTEEQKEKMGELAEKLGWRMQKQSEELIVELCNEIGIKRQVFKVWMHNNKQSSKRKPTSYVSIGK